MHDQLVEIARSGVLAPSADNQHVFRLELTDTAIRLWRSEEFAACKEPHRRALGLISLGAVVENMQLRAGQLGLAIDIRWSLASAVGPVAEIEVNKHAQSASPSDLALAIARRHTNRRMYHGPGLSDADAAQLSAATAEVRGAQVQWLVGDSRRRALRMIWRAESERFQRRRLHEELFSSIRFDVSWRESADYALPPGALEIESPMRPLFSMLKNWALMRALAGIGVHRLLGLRAGWLPCWQAPALGLVLTNLPLDAGAVAVGQAFQRLWLRATLMNLALQPMAASVVLPLQKGDHAQGASVGLRSMLESGWRSIAPPGFVPLMLFRLGRADAPTVTAGRLAIDHYAREATRPESRSHPS
jgi:hypothetical protein